MNDDGEPMATDEQRGQFVALCDAAEMDRQDRADLVKQLTDRTAWKDVTKSDAEKLLNPERWNGLVVAKGQDGKWFAYPQGEPWDTEGAAGAAEASV